MTTRFATATIAAALSGLLLLATVSPAGGATRRLSADVRGDANARVSMKIISRRGTPRKVKALGYSRLDHQCSDGMPREYSDRVPGRIKITKPPFGAYTFFSLTSTETTEQIFASGNPNRRGRVVRDGEISATVRFYDPSQPSQETSCTASVEDYVAR